MPNTREKLIELVVYRDMECNYMDCTKCDYFKVKYCKASMIADHLIANGVTVQQLDGCEYCKADNDGFRRMFGAFSLVNPFHGKGWQIHAGKCKPREIHYCPMCGRKLSEPPKGE